MRRTSVWVYFAIVVLGCGSSVAVNSRGTESSDGGASTTTVSSTSGMGGTSPTTNTVATTSSTGAGGNIYVDCPNTAPENGTACSGDLRCSYGDSIPGTCRLQAACEQGAWSIFSNICSNPGTCPSTAPTNSGSCMETGLICGYPDGTVCNCSQCPEGLCTTGGPSWVCGGPPTTPDCPPIVPNEGTECTKPDLDCFYPPGCLATDATCTNGVWTWNPVACAG